MHFIILLSDNLLGCFKIKSQFFIHIVSVLYPKDTEVD